MALIAQEPTPPEILVERVKPIRFAEATGRTGEVFAMTSSFG